MRIRASHQVRTSFLFCPPPSGFCTLPMVLVRSRIDSQGRAFPRPRALGAFEPRVGPGRRGGPLGTTPATGPGKGPASKIGRGRWASRRRGGCGRLGGCKSSHQSTAIRDSTRSGPASFRTSKSARLRLRAQGPLGGLSGGVLLAIPTARGGDPFATEMLGGVDEKHEVAEVVPAGLQQDGGVEDHHRGLSAAGDPVDGLLEGPTHPGVEDRLQVASGGGRIEDDPGQGPAIDPEAIVVRPRSARAGPCRSARRPRLGSAAGRAGRDRRCRPPARSPRDATRPTRPGSCRRRSRR